MIFELLLTLAQSRRLPRDLFSFFAANALSQCRAGSPGRQRPRSWCSLSLANSLAVAFASALTSLRLSVCLSAPPMSPTSPSKCRDRLLARCSPLEGPRAPSRASFHLKKNFNVYVTCVPLYQVHLNLVVRGFRHCGRRLPSRVCKVANHILLIVHFDEFPFCRRRMEADHMASCCNNGS